MALDLARYNSFSSNGLVTCVETTRGGSAYFKDSVEVESVERDEEAGYALCSCFVLSDDGEEG